MRAISDTLYFESKIQTLNLTSKILFIKRRLFLFNGYLEAVALNIQGGGINSELIFLNQVKITGKTESEPYSTI